MAPSGHPERRLESPGGCSRRRQQPALQQMRQPLGAGEIRLAARHVLDVPGVADQHLLEGPMLDQGVIHRHAVDPGGFHRHVRDAQRHQPAGRLGEHPVKRLERPLDRLPAIRAVAGQPDRHRDHVLAHVNRGTPLINHLHAASEAPSNKDAHAARRALKQAKRLILAFATQPGTPEGQGSSVNLVHGLVEPSRTDVGGPHAHRHSHPPGSGPQGPSRSSARSRQASIPRAMSRAWGCRRHRGWSWSVGGGGDQDGHVSGVLAGRDVGCRADHHEVGRHGPVELPRGMTAVGVLTPAAEGVLARWPRTDRSLGSR
jgi:hypothetical protein